MSEVLYPRDKLGAWIKANAPAEYGPATRIRLVAREDGMCVVTECPEDITIPAPEDLPEVGNLTDVEKMQAGVQARLDGDEEKRTGVRPNQSGAVPLSRSWAATAMLYAGWHYPTEADLAAGNNPAILAKIYADPTTNTTDKSSVAQKQRALHFTLVMLEGQAFGLDYQAELGAYERTASGAFLAKLALDKRDWLDLPVHTWPSVRAMFADLMG